MSTPEAEAEAAAELAAFRAQRVPYGGWKRAGFWAAGVVAPWRDALAQLGDELRVHDVARFVGCSEVEAAELMGRDVMSFWPADRVERSQLAEARLLGTLLIVGARAEGTFAELAARAVLHGAPDDVVCGIAAGSGWSLEDLWAQPVTEILKLFMFRMVVSNLYASGWHVSAELEAGAERGSSGRTDRAEIVMDELVRLRSCAAGRAAVDDLARRSRRPVPVPEELRRPIFDTQYPGDFDADALRRNAAARIDYAELIRTDAMGGGSDAPGE